MKFMSSPACKNTASTIPTFSGQLSACEEEKEPKPYFLVIYRWTKEGLGPENFVLPQHGNATRRTTSAYYRKDPQLLAEIDGFLEKGMSTDQVYSTTANRKEDTVSQTV